MCVQYANDVGQAAREGKRPAAIVATCRHTKRAGHTQKPKPRYCLEYTKRREGVGGGRRKTEGLFILACAPPSHKRREERMRVQRRKIARFSSFLPRIERRRWLVPSGARKGIPAGAKSVLHVPSKTPGGRAKAGELCRKLIFGRKKGGFDALYRLGNRLCEVRIKKERVGKCNRAYLGKRGGIYSSRTEKTKFPPPFY